MLLSLLNVGDGLMNGPAKEEIEEYFMGCFKGYVF